MKKINKKFITSIFIFFIFLLLSVSIIMANSVFDEIKFEEDSEKIYYEIKYFDSEILYMLTLLNNRNSTINWNDMQKEIKIFYNYWNSAILDLNYLDIDKEELTAFGKQLDQLLISVEHKNKDDVLINLVKLYEKLITYTDKINYNNYKSLLLVKYNLLLAFSIVDTENWTLIHEYILKASKNMYTLVNLIDIDQYEQYNINQTYVAIKEMENIVNIKNKELFYIKYQLALDKLENL